MRWVSYQGRKLHLLRCCKICDRCKGDIGGRPKSDVKVGPDKLEVVASLCYLGDILSVGGGLSWWSLLMLKPSRRCSWNLNVFFISSSV